MKKNKFIHYILICLGLLVFQTACSDNDKNAQAELIVSTEAMSLLKTGETKAMHIKTNVSWTITSSESWCTISPASGEGTGTIKIEVTATENTGTDQRTAILEVKAGSLAPQQVKLTQEANDLLLVTKDLYEIDNLSQEIAVELQISGKLDIKINADWISQLSTRAVTNKTEKFLIEANNTFANREGTIQFTMGDLIKTVTIKQKGVQLTIPANKTGMNSDAVALAAEMGLGWNLGNTLEATSGSTANETMWGNPQASKKLIDGIKSAGFNTVRIPCAWTAYLEDETGYKIKDSWLARVKEVVDYCVDNEMYAIINIHWDGGWLEENPKFDKQEAVNKKQKALWEQIAVYFRDYDEHLLFAGTNEVHDGYGEPTAENIEVQLSYNQTFVDAVRSTGGRNAWRNLIVQAYNTNIDHAIKYLKMPTDGATNRMMAEVHYYDPYDFCLDENSSVFVWGKDFYGEGVDVWGQEDWVDKQFARVKTNFVDKGIPVVLGEYGVMLRASLGAADYENHIKARNYYLNYVTKSAVQHGMIPVYWDSGITGDKASGLFDRATGVPVHADAVKAIVDAGK